jgi:putative aldouronate transport system substrate-binding protein
MAQTNVSRRRFLAVGGTALATALGGAALAGCGSDSDRAAAPTGGTGSGPTPSTGATSSSAPSPKQVLPSYRAYEGVAPDLPSTDLGAEPYFAHYPANPPTMYASPPASGGDVTALCIVPKPIKKLSDNQYWQALNKSLGVTFNFVGAPNDSYPAKFATMVAGDQIPDLAQIYSTATDLQGLLTAKFEDLTDYLAGDQINQYPGLANIPAYCWQDAVYSGRLYGVPLQRPPVQTWGGVRAASAEAAGVDPQPKDGKEFIALCKALTNTRKNQWALRSPDAVLGWVNAMVGTPNVWQVEGGKFTTAYATDQYKQALSIVRDLWTAGYFEPDTLSISGDQRTQWYVSGRVPIMLSGSSWSSVAISLKKDNGGDTVAISPPKWEGGGMAKSYLGTGILTITSVKKTGDPARVQELLRILDWMAAPFGTKEYLQKLYGVEGVDYTLNGTDPVRTDTGNAERIGATIYVANGPGVQYNPDFPEISKAAYEAGLAALKNSWPWPTAGLYSPTDQSQGAALNKKIADIALDITVNRKPVSAWDDAVKSWRSGGGDKIAQEYETEHQKFGNGS